MADSSLEIDRQRYYDLLASIGKSTVNALYPDDFEFYMLSLELADYRDQTIDFFSFPIMPKNFSEVEQSITNIKKTLSTVTSIKSTGFVPRDIRLSGNFGRGFKLLLGKELVTGSAFSLSSFQASNVEKENQSFSSIVKTGYGCFKLLEALLQNSKKLDDGLPRRLYFYNPALGNSYLVEFMEMNKSISQEENMIWGYSVFLRAIAPLSSLRSNLTENRAKGNSAASVSSFINTQAKDLLADLSSL